MSRDLAETTEFVRRLVKEQAAVSMRRWGSAGAITHEDGRDLTTDADLEIEHNLRRALLERFPEHGFRGEETGSVRPDAPRVWLVDPIDGTKWYAAHSILFAVSVALLERGEPVLGVVTLPASGQCFHAFAGGGAHLDGRRLPGPGAGALDRAIANVDTPNTQLLPSAERDWFERKLIALTRSVYRIRALGAGSLAACWLASGALDAYIDLTGHVKDEDLAAGRIIMREAGARSEYVEVGLGPPRLVAAAPAIWEPLRALLVGPG